MARLASGSWQVAAGCQLLLAKHGVVGGGCQGWRLRCEHGMLPNTSTVQPVEAATVHGTHQDPIITQFKIIYGVPQTGYFGLG